MYSAPSVTYPVGPSFVARRWLLAVWGLGTCCTAASGFGFPGLESWRVMVLVAGPVMAGLMAWATLCRLGAGDLSFQDQAWSLSGDRPVFDARVRVALDLQHAMLLRIAGHDGHGRWVWVERGDGVPRWLDLRRAVHAMPSGGSTTRSDADTPDHRPSVSAA
jgi:toxin CptA